MNLIAKWCQFKDYRDWCYKYRIPEEKEFVEGFEYERVSQIKSTDTLYGTEKYTGTWKKCIVRNPKKYPKGYKPSEDEKWEDGIVKQIKLYLEDGLIRVSKSDESINNSNKQNQKVMKVFYFEVSKKELEIIDSKIKGFDKTALNAKYKYIINNGIDAKNAYDTIKEVFKIKDNGFGEFQGILNLEGSTDSGYVLKSGGREITKENINDLDIKYEDCLITDFAMYDFSELWPKNTEPNINKNLGEPVKKIVENSLPEKEILSKVSTKNGIKPLINAFSRLVEKITIPVYKRIKGKDIKIKNKIIGTKKISIKAEHITIVDTLHKYPSRLDSETNIWKPVIKPEIKHQSKSEKRLVCVATKDKKIFQRIPYNEAEVLIKNHSEYEFISKAQYRKLSRTFKFFNTLDNKYEKATIPIKPGLSFTPAIGDKVYKERKKITPNPSSSKKAKCLRKSSHTKQGISGKRVINTYEVNFFRNMKEGDAEFVYTITARNEEHAIARASKKAELEGADLAYYKPKVELKSKGNTNVKIKGDDCYKRIILPQIIDLPGRKDKKGNIIPWTVKEVSYNSETKKIEVTNKEIKTFTGYQITYQKISSPFKKSPKKWKHPIKDGRNKVKVITSKNNKTIVIKKK